jgi:hypothetical protein
MRFFESLRELDVLVIDLGSFFLCPFVLLMHLPPFLLRLTQRILCLLCPLLSSSVCVFRPAQCYAGFFKLVLKAVLVSKQRIVLGKQPVSLGLQMCQLLVQHKDRRRSLTDDTAAWSVSSTA